VQSDTSTAIKAIGEIAQIIGQISEIQTGVAGAVEQQNAATAEISRNVVEAARGTADVSDNISSVTQVAIESGHTAEAIKSASIQLSAESERLRAAVDGFLAKMRSV
jgi:methyl-accepting chemotaxis protein